jgi:hypothetical protein
LSFLKLKIPLCLEHFSKILWTLWFLCRMMFKNQLWNPLSIQVVWNSLKASISEMGNGPAPNQWKIWNFNHTPLSSWYIIKMFVFLIEIVCCYSSTDCCPVTCSIFHKNRYQVFRHWDTVTLAQVSTKNVTPWVT